MDAFLDTEHRALQPLAATAFPIFASGARTVHADGHVEVDGSFYPVPLALLGHGVRVQWDARLVRVFHGDTLVAVHAKVAAGLFSPTGWSSSDTGSPLSGTSHPRSWCAAPRSSWRPPGRWWPRRRPADGPLQSAPRRLDTGQVRLLLDADNDTQLTPADDTARAAGGVWAFWEADPRHVSSFDPAVPPTALQARMPTVDGLTDLATVQLSVRAPRLELRLVSELATTNSATR